MRRYFVYILSSKSRVLYIGITHDIVTRLFQHRTANDDSFSSRYRVFHLVLLEEYASARDAIAREKQLKGWRREKKEWLIGLSNPLWIDISSTWDRQGMFCISATNPTLPRDGENEYGDRTQEDRGS